MRLSPWVPAFAGTNGALFEPIRSSLGASSVHQAHGVACTEILACIRRLPPYRSKLRDKSTEELVERFARIALEQDEALLGDEIPRHNRLYWQMEAIEEELKSRTGDQRDALTALHAHPNAQLRLKSAIVTLALAPNAARRVLQMISDYDEYPQAAYARGILTRLDEGTFVPS